MNKQTDSKQGIVKWFNAEKGFGFITAPTGEDVFVHYTAITTEGYKTLEEGQEVTYNLIDGKKGKQANDVQIITKK